MGYYSTELREVLADLAGISLEGSTVKPNEIIDSGLDLLFDFQYEIFDEEYRKVLERKIAKHFFMREISYEDVDYWRFKLDVKINEIMPYYNQLYKSALIEINPLYTVNLSSKKNDTVIDDREISETNTGTVTNTGTNQSESTNNSDNTKSGTDTKKNVGKGGNTTQTDNVTTTTGKDQSTANGTQKDVSKFADTPQGGLDGVESGEYLTNATIANSNSNQNGTLEHEQSVKNNDKIVVTESKVVEESVEYGGATKVVSSGTNKVTENQTRTDDLSKTVKDKLITDKSYIETVAGTNGVSESRLLEEYRKTFLNIDLLVIGELEELFIQIW